MRRGSVGNFSVDPAIERRILGRTRASRRALQYDLAEDRGSIRGGPAMTGTGIAIALPFVLMLVGYATGFGAYALLALPLLAVTVWLARRAGATDRSPLVQAFRRRRRRRRALRRARAAERHWNVPTNPTTRP